MLIAAEPLQIATDVWLLPGFADTARLLPLIERIATQSPFRHMQVPGGAAMAVAVTNCGELGWTSDAHGYAYRPQDPLTGQPWPALPEEFRALAASAAAVGGWPDFRPDACLVNRYAVGAGVGLHQDRNEADFAQPIVSVSLGASCRFMLGGLTRKDAVRSHELHDGDVMVWGGSARLVYHGVRPLRFGLRYNITLRRARPLAATRPNPSTPRH
jgi:alkylated DNA repair protein (DNA oxidative demethylase)